MAALCGMAASMLLSPLASAQSNAVAGTVTDETGAPLVGVYVAAVGTQNATMTDIDGRYALNVPAGATELTFSLMGMEDVTVAIAGRKEVNAVMKENALFLEEAVAIGYGTIIRKELTSSVASVKADELVERASAASIGQTLQGKLAGVSATYGSGRPGGAVSVRVRGKGSINASSNPLYVMDGIVDVDPDMINSADIESIDVLKDAAATAMYGAKGANGVVLITTKSGKAGQGTVTFDTKTGITTQARKLDLMNAEEFMQAQAMAYAYSGQSMPHLTTPMENLFYYQKDGDGNYVYDENGLLIASPIYDTDWQSEGMRTGLVTTNTLSFQQGNEKNSVYASLGYQNIQGLLKATYSEKYTAMVNFNSHITNWLDASFSASLARTGMNNADNEGSMNQGALRNFIEMPPIVPVQYPDGTWGKKNDYPLGEAASSYLQQMEYMYKRVVNVNALVNAGLTFKILPGLTLTVNGNYNVKSYTQNFWAKQGLYDWSKDNNQASINHSQWERWSNEDYLTYDKTFFDGVLKSNFVLGASWYYYKSEGVGAATKGVSSDSFEYHNLGTGTVPQTPSSSYDKQTMNSYYFRTNQVILGRYMIGATFRADGASCFGANNKYGFFPSVSAGWNIAEEPFFEPAKEYVNNMKLRLSYGHVGNASIGSYATLASYNSGNVIFGDAYASAVTLSKLANGDLHWETAKQFDAGLDFGFLNDRINVITDFYIKRSCDLLYNKMVPYSTGYSTSTMNVGELRNTGFELTINSHNIDRPDFKWDTDFIFSTNRTMTVNLNGEIIDGGSKRSVEGQKWNQWFVLHRIGTWGTDEVAEAARYNQVPGDIKWEDKNNDGKYDDEDRYYAGQAAPKAEFSFVNTFRYKGITLMIDLGAAVGMKVYSNTQNLIDGQFVYTTGYKSLLNSWTPDNQNTMLPALRLPTDSNYGTSGGVGGPDDYWLQKADFLRLRNVSLSYDFKDLLKNVKGIKGLIVGVSGENLYVLTPYKGYDPEVSWGESGSSAAGMDWYAYPRPMSITGNIKITF